MSLPLSFSEVKTEEMTNIPKVAFATGGILKVYCNAFWPGFMEGTDPVSVGFFLELLNKTFEETGSTVVVTPDPREADILLESLFGASIKSTKKWKYTIFFSGEWRICTNFEEYDCVLWGEATHNNVVCCPEFVPYLYSTQLLRTLEARSLEVSTLASNNRDGILLKPRICVVISNPGGHIRNRFLDILERYFTIDYAGRFRNNVKPIAAPYTSLEFREFVGQYKCVLCMENSQGGDYVTEKITHALLAGNVPIYWGASRVGKYFNTERFIHVEHMDEEGIGMIINEVMAVMNDDVYYSRMVSQPMFVDASGTPGHQLSTTCTLDAIADNMRHVLFKEESD
jgi:hypothetical protein